jgi:hypothetical protein
MPRPAGHFHTGPIDIVVTTIGVLVVVQVMRVVAGKLVDHPVTAGAGKVLAAFALSD